MRLNSRMNYFNRSAALSILLVFGGSLSIAADLPAKATTRKAGDAAVTAAALLKASGLTPSQLLGGTNTGLSAMLDFAAAELAKPGAVQVPTPPSMAKIVNLAKKLNQTGALDSFKASLNAAAASVMPQTTAVLKESLAGITLDDAMTLTSGAPDSATRLLRKAAEPALRARVMPLIAQAIAVNGTAAKAKDLAVKAGPMAAMLGVPNAEALESFLFSQVLDTSFSYIAKGEAAVRANPALLKNTIAATVFSFVKK